ncbi:winged helix DNA-binding protein [Mesorhizobium sp. AR10]|uniref:winged helix DNA-binding protein n=1 Tax=Mesorhizobium sp. AR10 TaxID=2865839 RepID=UPI0039B6EA3A
MEFALTMSNHAFHRWMVRCMSAAGGPDLAALDILVLHLVHHRMRPKSLADISLVLNIEDSHLVTYSVKKLVGHGLVTGGRKGKEKTITTTSQGEELCRRYAEVREALLVRAVQQLGLDPAEVSRLAGLLRAISGSYDQAARAAAAAA